MSPKVEQALQTVLALPWEQREELFARLSEILEEDEQGLELEEGWKGEIEGRMASIESGKEQTIPWDEARRMILEDHDESSSS